MKKLISLILLLAVAVGGPNVSAYAAKSTAHRTARHAAKSITTPVSINKASAAQLTTLSGIGPKKAAAIVAYREQHGDFKRLSDLSQVKGIGAKWIARLERRNPERVRLN